MTKRVSPPLTKSSSQPLDDANARRRQELSKLLPMWPHEIADMSLEGRRRLVQKLERALREERLRGKGGHWAYDLTRHHDLARLWRTEARELQLLERATALASKK